MHRYYDIIREKYREIGIEMNERKTQIVKLSHTFTFLQDRYVLTDSGKVIRKPGRKSITRNRRKLRKLAKLLENGEIDYKSIRSFYASQDGNLKHKNAYRTRKNMQELHDELFIRRWNNVPIS